MIYSAGIRTHFSLKRGCSLTNRSWGLAIIHYWIPLWTANTMELGHMYQCGQINRNFIGFSAIANNLSICIEI